MSFPRTRKFWWIALMVLTSVPSVPSLGDDLLPKAPGSYERVLQTGDFDLRFGVEVPQAGEGSDPKPLILALHYGFDSNHPFPEHYGKAFMDQVVSPGFRNLNAFIVAPDSHGHHWADAEIGRAVSALLDRLTADPRIDASKVIVTGYSMGGTGSWFFASQHTERFAAAVPMAGRLRSEWLSQLGDLPVHVLHSADDELISVAQVREILATKANENVRLTELQGITHYQSPRYADAIARTVVPWLKDVFSSKD